jgi:hypothetical protein
MLFTPSRTKSRESMRASARINCTQARGGVAPLRGYRLQPRFRAPLYLVAVVDSHRTRGAQRQHGQRSNAATGSSSKLHAADPEYARNIELMVLI